jgi:cell pole-organizing protein PopZ
MSDQQRKQPSMEEILTSIRRIISQDSAQRRDPSFGRPAAAPSPPADGIGPERTAGEVLLLTEIIADNDPVVRIEPVDATPAVDRREPVFQRALEEADRPPRRETRPAGPGLISEERAAASAALLRELVRNVTQANEMSLGSDPTLEALVREALPPLLSDWLDARLPPLIERLVREEIQRIVARADQKL